MQDLKHKVVLGIDIGGTKLAAGIVTAAGQVITYRREPTDQSVTANQLFAQVLSLAQQVIIESQLVPTAVGIGCGGPMRYPEGIVSPLHIPIWHDFPLRERMTQALQLPVIVDNDAKAFAFGEALFGAGRGATNFLGMVVSTGVGGGIVINGKLQHGTTGNAGHIGHSIVFPNGVQCECGARGCLTAYASGTAIAKRAHTALKRGVVSSLNPSELVAKSIVQAAYAGDTFARQLITAAGVALGRAIAGAAALLDLDRVVIGGGVAQSGAILFEPLQAEYSRRARLPFTRQLVIKPANLIKEAGVIGAAALINS